MHQGIEMGLVAIIAAGFVVWGLVAAALGRLNVSAPIAFVAAGMIIASLASSLDISGSSESVRLLTELTLAVVLFGDAVRVPLLRLEADAALPGRLLIVGLPLTIAAGTVAAHLVLPGLSWWVCAVIAAAVAPTDAALGAAIIDDERVPRRIRRALNVESGLNDGIATPFVSFFIIAAVAGTAFETGSRGHALLELGLGALIGGALGLLSARTMGATLRRGLAQPAFVPIAAAAVALLAYAATVAAGANGFVAAFVGGLAFGYARPAELPAGSLRFTRQVGRVLSLTVWFVFGALVIAPLENLTWREVLFALLALTVVRMVPVALALIGLRLDRATVAVIGWFGPRGLASVVFALLAAEALAPDDATRVLVAIGVTVLLSVLLHGVTSAPIARRYGSTRRGRVDAAVTDLDDDPEGVS